MRRLARGAWARSSPTAPLRALRLMLIVVLRIRRALIHLLNIQRGHFSWPLRPFGGGRIPVDSPGGAGRIIRALALGLKLVVAPLLGGLDGNFLFGYALQVGVHGALPADVGLVVPAVVLIGDGSVRPPKQHPIAPEDEVALIRVDQRAQGCPAALVVPQVHLLQPRAPQQSSRVVAQAGSRGHGVLQLGLDKSHSLPCHLCQMAVHLLDSRILLPQLHHSGFSALQHLSHDLKIRGDQFLLLRVLRRPVLPSGEGQGTPRAVHSLFRLGHRRLRGTKHLFEGLLGLGALHLVVPVLGPSILQLPLQLLHLTVALA
mmetsp:Transcript_23793/g.52373  ORF Transcript_23793/g.52373 Transcript_23793/m.52373 type:complete len:316 (-) Transcript_23793:1007-1954(-)